MLASRQQAFGKDFEIRNSKFEISDGLRGLNSVKRVFDVRLYLVEEISQLPYGLGCGGVIHTTFKYADGVRSMSAIGEGAHEDRRVLVEQLDKLLPDSKTGRERFFVSAKILSTEIAGS